MTDNFKFNVGDRVRLLSGVIPFLILARNASPGRNEYWCEHGGGTFIYRETDITLSPPVQRDFMGAWAWAKYEGKVIKQLSDPSFELRYDPQLQALVSKASGAVISMWTSLIEATDWVLA